MGHELEDVGNGIEAFYAETPFWHNLGTVTPGALKAAEALEIAKLLWRVEKRPLWADVSEGSVPVVGAGIPILDKCATVRTDVNKVLGIVGSDYALVQNGETARMVDDALAEAGIEVRYESAGALRGGRLVWFLARLSETLQIGRNADQVKAYALGLTSHDGSRSLSFFPTGIRVGCMNTLRMAEGEAEIRVSFPHTGRLRERFPAVVAAWRRCAQGVGEFEATAQKMAGMELDGSRAEAFGKVIASMVQAIVKGRDEEAEKRRRAESAKILRHFQGDGTPGNGQGNSVWDAYQAVDYWLEHEARKFRTGESRFESVIYGEVASLKGRAFSSLAGVVAA